MLTDAAGKMILNNGAPSARFTACKIPIGSDPFVKGYLEAKQQSIVLRFDKIADLLNPGCSPLSEIPSSQMLWILMVVCFQFMEDY